ncbi:MAG: hypothetical protein M5U08_12670 [Burkholderiales bacterium]|nr:hypothetical protein [Burkholderiales bacterium]
MKTIAAPRRQAFFYPRPVLSDPAADLTFVAFQGAPRRLLRTPAQVMQQSPDMIDVVADAEPLLDELGHARTGPKIGIKTGRERPFDQQRLETTLLMSLELWRSAGRSSGAHCRLAVLACRCLPASHAASIHTYSPRNFRRKQPFVQQCQRAQSAALQLFWTSGRSHGTPPTGSIGHYLRRRH